MPAAKPAALKLLNGRGNGKDSAGREVNLGPAFVRQAPDPPDWLSDEARAEWIRVVPELERLRLLSRVTRSSLVAYCETWATFVTATMVIRELGLTFEAKQGTIARPEVAIQRTTGAELRRWAVEYGLTPASEQKIKPAPDDSEDDDLLD